MMKSLFTKMHNSIALRISAMALALLLICVCCVSVVSTTRADDVDNYSFYNASSAASGFLSKALAPDDDNSESAYTAMLPDIKSVNMSDAGGYLGYNDIDKTGGIVGWLESALSGSSVTYSMTTFDDTAKYGDGFIRYLQFGSLLNELGLDSSGTSFGGNMIRFIAGLIAAAVYVMASTVDAGFAVMISLLQLLNPFSWFISAIEANTGIRNPNMGTLGTNSTMVHIANWIKDYINQNTKQLTEV